MLSLVSSTKARLGGVALVIGLLGAVGYMRPGIGANTPSGWPRIELPANADSFDIGQEVSSNGVPMRMSKFASNLSLPETVAWFKSKLGQPLLEDHVGEKTVLGRPQGDYYITIQLEQSGAGVQGLIGISNMRQALSEQGKSREANAAWARDLPADTKIVNLMTSHDDGKDAVFLMATNQYSNAVNIDRATSALEKRGFLVERRIKIQDGDDFGFGVADPAAQTVLFKSEGKEATAMAFHDPSGTATIVINTTVVSR